MLSLNCFRLLLRLATAALSLLDTAPVPVWIAGGAGPVGLMPRNAVAAGGFPCVGFLLLTKNDSEFRGPGRAVLLHDRRRRWTLPSQSVRETDGLGAGAMRRAAGRAVSGIDTLSLECPQDIRVHPAAPGDAFVSAQHCAVLPDTPPPLPPHGFSQAKWVPLEEAYKLLVFDGDLVAALLLQKLRAALDADSSARLLRRFPRFIVARRR
jgi:hypothetical protein